MRVAARPVLERINRIDQELRSGRYPNSVRLAEVIEVDPRTIQRDLAFLKDRMGAPIEYDRKKGGYYYAEPSYALPFLQLTEGELLALVVAQRTLGQYQGSPWLPALRRAFRKICDRLPEHVSVDLAAFDPALSFRSGPTLPLDLQIFRVLLRALRGRRSVWVRYWSAHRDAVAERILDPWHLACVGGDWYLLAHDYRSAEVRTFAAARIRAIRDTGKRFRVPPGFRPEDYLGDAFRVLHGKGRHRVRLRFTGEAARYAGERTWHPTQKVLARGEGEIVLEMTLSDLREIGRWALSWGSGCRVLAPAALRDWVRGEVEGMAASLRGNAR